MNVLVVEPGIAPYEKEINSFEEMKSTVGGQITVIYPFEEQAAIFSNDNGINLGLPFNRSIESGDCGIFGTFFVCGLTANTASENQGYVIQQSVLFDNGRGFALGEHPRAGFVTWQFTEEEGHRDYYWGHYHSDKTAAGKDFSARIVNHQRQYDVHEVNHSGFCSLTPEQMEHYKQKFHQAEILVDFKGNTLVTLKVEPRPIAPHEQPKHPPKKPGR